MESEVRSAISKMKKKAAGPDGIVIEMIAALDDFRVEKNHKDSN